MTKTMHETSLYVNVKVKVRITSDGVISCDLKTKEIFLQEYSCKM